MRSLILNTVNGQTEQLTDWSQIKWRQVNKLLRNLQRRIFRARKLGQWKQLRRLQKLLMKSYTNLLNSVRQITQINTGKRTAGVDKEVINTPNERVKLANSWEMPKAQPTRRVYIPKSNGKNSENLTLFNIANHPIVRHIKVKGTASPFDAKRTEYWKSRSKKLGKTKWAKGSKYYQVAENQKWKCPICGNTLTNGEEIETHHIIQVKEGGSNDKENLVHLHKACHKHEHNKTKKKA